MSYIMKYKTILKPCNESDTSELKNLSISELIESYEEEIKEKLFYSKIDFLVNKIKKIPHKSLENGNLITLVKAIQDLNPKISNNIVEVIIFFYYK